MILEFIQMALIVIVAFSFIFGLMYLMLRMEKCKKCKSERIHPIVRYEHYTSYGMFDDYEDYKIHQFGYTCQECGFTKVNKKKLERFERNR